MEEGPYAFETIMKQFVDREKSGFNQCRDKVIGFTDQRLSDLKYLEFDPVFEAGADYAYREILRYLKGVQTVKEADSG